MVVVGAVFLATYVLNLSIFPTMVFGIIIIGMALEISMTRWNIDGWYVFSVAPEKPKTWADRLTGRSFIDVFHVLCFSGFLLAREVMVRIEMFIPTWGLLKVLHDFSVLGMLLSLFWGFHSLFREGRHWGNLSPLFMGHLLLLIIMVDFGASAYIQHLNMKQVLYFGMIYNDSGSSNEDKEKALLKIKKVAQEVITRKNALLISLPVFLYAIHEGKGFFFPQEKRPLLEEIRWQLAKNKSGGFFFVLVYAWILIGASVLSSRGASPQAPPEPDRPAIPDSLEKGDR